jgi:uncharacterized protein YneF (UPF0154 family)
MSFIVLTALAVMVALLVLVVAGYLLVRRWL